MAPHTINTAVVTDRQLESAIFFIKIGSYSQNIIINANSNKY